MKFAALTLMCLSLAGFATPAIAQIDLPVVDPIVDPIVDPVIDPIIDTPIIAPDPIDIPVIDPIDVPVVTPIDPVVIPPVVVDPINTPVVDTPTIGTPPITVGGDGVIDVPGVIGVGTPIDLGGVDNAVDGVVGAPVSLPGGNVIQPVLDTAGNPVGAVDTVTGEILQTLPDGTVLNPAGQPVGNINTSAGGNGVGGNGAGGAATNSTNVDVDNENNYFSIPNPTLGYFEEVTTDTTNNTITRRSYSVPTLNLTGGVFGNTGVGIIQLSLPLR